jgi:hypothetical protein
VEALSVYERNAKLGERVQAALAKRERPMSVKEVTPRLAQATRRSGRTAPRRPSSATDDTLIIAVSFPQIGGPRERDSRLIIDDTLPRTSRPTAQCHNDQSGDTKEEFRHRHQVLT